MIKLLILLTHCVEKWIEDMTKGIDGIVADTGWPKEWNNDKVLTDQLQ